MSHAVSSCSSLTVERALRDRKFGWIYLFLMAGSVRRTTASMRMHEAWYLEH
jgi:hypothetical protein